MMASSPDNNSNTGPGIPSGQLREAVKRFQQGLQEAMADDTPTVRHPLEETPLEQVPLPITPLTRSERRLSPRQRATGIGSSAALLFSLFLSLLGRHPDNTHYPDMPKFPAGTTTAQPTVTNSLSGEQPTNNPSGEIDPSPKPPTDNPGGEIPPSPGPTNEPGGEIGHN